MNFDSHLIQAEDDLRRVYEAVRDRLHPRGAEEITTYIDHREFGLAAEGLFWFIDAMSLAIELQTLARLRRLDSLTNMHGDFDPRIVERVLDTRHVHG